MDVNYAGERAVEIYVLPHVTCLLFVCYASSCCLQGICEQMHTLVLCDLIDWKLMLKKIINWFSHYSMSFINSLIIKGG